MKSDGESWRVIGGGWRVMEQGKEWWGLTESGGESEISVRIQSTSSPRFKLQDGFKLSDSNFQEFEFLRLWFFRWPHPTNQYSASVPGKEPYYKLISAAIQNSTVADTRSGTELRTVIL